MRTVGGLDGRACLRVGSVERVDVEVRGHAASVERDGRGPK